jgi:hypothetical protein
MTNIDLTQLEQGDSHSEGVDVDDNPEGEGASGNTLAKEILVVGVADWAIAEAAAQLVAAGRTVHLCSDSAETPFPCNALVPGRGCPLDRHNVDVVLDVHSSPRSKLQLSEMGVICGLRARLPLVIGGISDDSVISPWAEHVPPGEDIVSTCDMAVNKHNALRSP